MEVPWNLFFLILTKDEDNDPTKKSTLKQSHPPKQKIDRHLNTTMKVVLVTGGFDPYPGHISYSKK